MLKNYLDGKKTPLLFCIFCILFFELVLAVPTEECFLEKNWSACCNIDSSNPLPTLCGCKGKTFEQCHDVTMNFVCQWQSNATVENRCATYLNSSNCFFDATCNWEENVFGNSSCFALRCEDRPCAIVDTQFCDLRPDCTLEKAENGNVCRSANCSCADYGNLDAYCPCLKTNMQCNAEEGCFWSEQFGCSVFSVSSSASTASLALAVMYFSAVALLFFD